MNATRPLKASFAAVAVTLLLGSLNSLAADGVVDSFERMLSYSPGPAMSVTGADRDADPLTQALVIPLRDGTQHAATTVDPVAASFARMLAHTPGPATPSVSADHRQDPLIAAMVEPLRAWLAESATTTQVASARATR